MTGSIRARLAKVRKDRDEGGYIAIVSAIIVSALFLGLGALSVDTASWWVNESRAQRAADAAAMAGVTWMPHDFANATTTAKEFASRNGYPDDGVKSKVEVSRTDVASELKVTVSIKVENVFGAGIGAGSTWVSRSAVADFNAPQPMGSPCNTFANEPDGSNPNAGPETSQLLVPAGATCPRYPQLWLSMAGPEVYKTQGDEFATRVCQGAESGCTGGAGGTNQEFNPTGYFMQVRVEPSAVGKPITLQLYDPAYASTGGTCTVSPSGAGFATTNWNPWANDDATTRYAQNYNNFCTGDDANSGLRRGTETPTITSFGLRAPNPEMNPLTATPVQGCARQYPGYSAFTKANLKSDQASYNANLARVFHAWKTLCTFTPSQAGSYYLQVRTNVAMQGAVNDDGSYLAPVSANARIFTQVGDDPAVLGNGSNRFAVRVVGGAAGEVNVAALNRMPIYINATGSTSLFNLIRVPPGAAGRSVIFTFYDVGDASSGATMQVLRPTEAGGDALSGCTASGYQNLSLSNCTITGVSGPAGWNGQAESIKVPIPANYTCNATSAGGCWFRLQVTFPGATSVTDATTWTAIVAGDPVRLIK